MLGYEDDVGSLILPEAEINLHGVSDELRVVGEASVRAEHRIVLKYDFSYVSTLLTT